MMSKEKVTLYIQNNTSASVPVSLLGNPNDLDNANAHTLYKWDLTTLSFMAGNITSLSVQYKPVGAAAYTTFTYSGNITSFGQLLDILNGANISIFYQLQSGANIYLCTNTELYVFNNLTLNPALGSNFVFAVNTSLGQTVGFTLNFTSSTNLSINWGDGVTQNFLGQTGSVSYSHTYPVPSGSTIFYPAFSLSLATNLTGMASTALGNILRVVDISAFTQLTSFTVAGNMLTGLPTLPPLLTTVNISSNFIPTPDINAALIAVDTAGLSGGTFNSAGQTPGAPPTGAGLVAKANLIDKGWTVTTD